MIVEHVFFDLDRTLWDFDNNSHEALSKIFDLFELKSRIPNKRGFIADYKRINERMWLQYRQGSLTKDELRILRFTESFSKYGILDNTMTTSFADAYLTLCPRLTRIFPNTIETLKDLKSRGKGLHIISNGFSEVQSIKLEQSGLIHFFDTVICSDELGVSKPDSRIFKHALTLSGANPIKSVMIGDHLRSDVLGASANGMLAVLFDPKDAHKNLIGVTKIRDLAELKTMLY